ncbi:CueP family metal-binding protein [Propioniferax innocua]|uniref:Uncharacterized protein n=1 Tax=Propioniferax innocua TaxID=1753 RepID=A0A542ZQQ7_9ACTN|nr:CueP family metal-binding protein [Propioniferax innocua]TQL62684.1 hypothetical protein FB460_0470 [Propioniferax innocua]
MRNRSIASVAAACASIGALMLTGCGTSTPTAEQSTSSNAAEASAADQILAPLGLAGEDAEQVIEALDRTPLAERPEDTIASVRHSELVLQNQSTEATLPIEGDKHYLSVAPYVSQTHECHFHSLTTCQGELANTPIDVKITDAQSGDVLIDKTITTYDNGFFGVWLPRDISYELTMSADGKSAVVPGATGQDDLTCMTTPAKLT